MELIHQFGFDPKLLVAQIVNFLVVLWVLKKYLYGPLLSMLNKRKKAIEEGLAQAEKARLLLEEITEKEKKILQEAQKQAEKIIEEAKEQALSVVKEAEEAAKERAEKIIEEAKRKIEHDTKETERRLTEHVSKIAIDFLQKALSDMFTEKTQQEVMTKALKIIKGKPN